MDPSTRSAASCILNALHYILDVPTSDILEIGQRHALPVFDEQIVSQLCDEARQLFEKTPMLVKQNTNAWIVGDLHGSLFDLLRILKETDFRTTPFIFLGDYVDRGEFSIEVMILLFALAVAYPSQFILLRGNHEFFDVCEKYGFRHEVLSVYGSEALWLKFVEAFEYMPIACLLNERHLCVHGGISPHLTSLDQILTIRRPLRDVTIGGFVRDLLWADPSDTIPKYSQSSRGEEYSQFGSQAFRQFLEHMGLKSVIRAHQCVEDGLKRQFHSLLTVFSSSSYQYNGSNKSAILYYTGENDIVKSRVFEPFPKFTRSDVMFVDVSLSKRARDDEPRKLPKLLCMALRSNTVGRGVGRVARSGSLRASDPFQSRPLTAVSGALSPRTEAPAQNRRKANIPTFGSARVTLRATYRTCPVRVPE